jgi:hypothetical protein
VTVRGGDVAARIYISATYGDFKEHREQVYRALRELGHDVVAMEDYVATDQRPLGKCLSGMPEVLSVSLGQPG